jgi:hypothetical protein
MRSRYLGGRLCVGGATPQGVSLSRGGNGWFRRVSPIAVRPGEGLLTERTAGVRPMRRERVFMPHTCRSRDPPGSAELGRVGVWRGGCRPNTSVAAPFVWRCLTGSPVAPLIVGV